jgi:hypothetical protein
MSEKTGGTAFPASFNKEHSSEKVGAMTLRDYFASKAMESMCDEVSRYDKFLTVAKDSYKMADAMMEARK